jgi:LPS export ABC transporter protein LptC
MFIYGECRRRRTRALQLVAGLVLVGVFGLIGAGSAWADEGADSPVDVFSNLEAELRVTGMTFVASREDVNEFVLRARRAFFMPDTNLAKLENVRVTATDEEDQSSFEVSCTRGELDVETNDFLAEGNVRGTTGDGRSYTASWVRYDHERALLYTDAPVTMTDDTGTFSGDGFRYHVKQRRFRLLGNVSLVQTP